MQQVTVLGGLCDQGRMTWTERERGWVAVPDEVADALARDGFEECKRELTTSRRDLRPAGGVWQGVNRITGSVASAIWIARGGQHHALVFIEIDGEAVTVGHGARPGSEDESPPGDEWISASESHREEGGES